MLGPRYSETDGKRSFRQRTERPQEVTQIISQFLPFTRHTRPRYRIEKPVRGFCDGLHSCARTGRRNQKDSVQSRGAHGLDEDLRFLEREITGEYSIET